MRGKLVVRVRFLSAAFILVAALLVGRLYMVQMVHGEEYAEAAVGQYVAEAPDLEERNDILFTKKDGVEVAAAVMQSGWRVAIQPKVMTDPEGVYAALSELATIDKERFFISAGKKDDPYEEVAYRIDDNTADAIRARGLEGVLVVRDQWRRYPAGELAAHAVGFVGFRGDRREGVYGLERYYEDTLQRQGAELYVNPFAEIFTNVTGVLGGGDERVEGSVVTVIEPNVQQELERALKKVADTYDAKQVGGIVMNPSTGDVVALGVYPTFDPNTYNTHTDTAIFSNPLVEGLYEMGSIVKPLAMAAALDAGAVKPSTTYEDFGSVMKSGKRISNYDGRARGVVDMQEVLNQSLNTGMAFVVDRMGKEALREYFTLYGLGEETGIDLPHEVAGNINVLDGNSDVDFASASFGQSIAVTPISMIRSLSALANGGVLAEPRVARVIRFKNGGEREVPQAPSTRVLSEESAETITRMLVTVFDDALLDGELKQEHHSIAAKTGTAQIASPACGGYCADRYLHSFFGYFPAYPAKTPAENETKEARFIVLLYAIEPRGEQYASRTLARPFMDIAKFLINYYDVPPDR